MAQRAKSITADVLADKTYQVAKEVLAGRMKEIGGRPRDIGFFPDIGVFGLIWDDLDFDRFPMEALLETSAKIGSGVGELARADIEPVVVVGRHGTTMGYFPRFDDVVLHKASF